MQDQTNPTNPNPADPFGGLNPSYPPMGGTQPPVQEPEDTTPANFQLGALFTTPLIVKIPANALQFDETRFLHLLAGSISLSRDEKKRIIETIPKLKQSQVDELIRIFEEEAQKFSQLSKKHVPQLEKLAKLHHQDWMDLETNFKAEGKQAEDQSKADEIRKSLGL